MILAYTSGKYRKETSTGISRSYPSWKSPVTNLAQHQMIDFGHHTIKIKLALWFPTFETELEE